MIDEEISALTTIDALILRKQPFAVYRIPGEKDPFLLTQTTGTIRVFHDLKELNGQKGFVIAPFQMTEGCPAVLIQPEQITPFSFSNHPFSVPSESSSPASTEQNNNSIVTPIPLLLGGGVSEGRGGRYTHYANCFSKFIEVLRNGTFDKLVLSRSLVMEKDSDFSLSAAYRAACQQYIHSYVYLCYTPQTGIWLGSTPEIILSGEKDEWNTVALAGTQPLQDGKLPQIWDEKNRKEQGFVSSYIRSQLLSLGIHPVENGPYPAYAGALSHLKTDFRFSLNNNKGLGNILELLHPTPAVCGLPKEKAYQFILDNEDYDRKYYSGFIGWLDPEGRTDLYVNLRCMHIDDKQLTLYAGGGLIAASELEDEWQETEKKMMTMKRIITDPIHH